MIVCSISFRVDSLALGQSYNCPSASEVTLKDMGKTDKSQTTTKHNKAWILCMILGKYLIRQLMALHVNGLIS